MTERDNYEPGLRTSAATITVKAFNALTNEPIVAFPTNKPIVETIECSTDIPADALGEVCANAMQRAWRTGVDGTEVRLVVEFS